jgi:hypothetical protein
MLDGNGYFRGLPRGRLTTIGGRINSFADVGVRAGALDSCADLEARDSTVDSVGNGGYMPGALGWSGFIHAFCLPPSPPKARLSVR